VKTGESARISEELRGLNMKRFVECEDGRQGVLLPEYLDDYVSENNPVRVIDVFVDELDLLSLGFEGVIPEATGRPSYHPATLVRLIRRSGIHPSETFRTATADSPLI